MNKIISLLILIPVLLLLTLFLIRLISHTEIDDVSPEIQCEKEYLEKADVLWVIPKFNNKSIVEEKEWCGYILGLNKTLGLHGIYHSGYGEFNQPINEEELKEAIQIFEMCFNQTPLMFKPPQLKISKENKELVEANGMKVKLFWNQLFHKVYHCNDTGKFPNRFIDLV